MMSTSTAVTLIFPHQLFLNSPALHKGVPVLLIENELFYTQYRFHKQKIAFHRISMRRYEERLKRNGFDTRYYNCGSPEATTAGLFSTLKSQGVTEVHVADPVDYLLERRIRRDARRAGISLRWYASPNFLCDGDELRSYFETKKKFFLTEFYMDHRKKWNILMDKGQPLGGKWTYDTENRKKMPASVKIPSIPVEVGDALTMELLKVVGREFAENPGQTDEFVYPTDHEAAERWLDAFLCERFSKFGDYQDAIVTGQAFLFHSLISPMLNVGLLDPRKIVDKALDAAVAHDVPINALEGFIRQLIGWREFIRAVYTLQGVGQRTRNFFGHKRKIPASFYSGTTGIPPVDDAIRKTLQHGYTHHIERLMVLGNFMLLCEFDPDEVYKWFMEMYIDAYDWVMVPNVYGMSQFADGGWMSTKPYISGSNYILKMSDHAKGDWCDVWDALYWRFIHQHRTVFIKNPRMSMMVRQVEKMDPDRFNRLMEVAEDYFRKIAS
jgi:deoxyribodipyrimidine photolyase-related protein